jgi:exodeoxyribonuclease V alpha subunit
MTWLERTLALQGLLKQRDRLAVTESRNRLVIFTLHPSIREEVATMAITLNQPAAGRTNRAPSHQVIGRTTSPRFRPAPEEQIEYVGVFRREVFSNADGFKIIKLEDGTTIKVNDLHNQLTAGLTYRFSGVWKESRNPAYPDKEFHARHFTIDKPTSERGVVGFLSKMCTNIGPFIARQIFAKFGDQSVEVVRTAPEKIAEAGILDFQKAQQAAECLQARDGMEQTKIALNEIFQGHGFRSSAIDACVKLWGSSAPEVVRRDPFKLMVKGVTGAGFTRCDKLYQDLQLPAGRAKRQMLAIWYKLKTNREGHTWVSAASLGVMPTKAIALGIRSKWIAEKIDSAGGRWYAEAQRAEDERAIAVHIKRLMAWKTNYGDQTKTRWPDMSELQGLSDHQREITATLLTSPVASLNGKPGSGKTYLLAKLAMWLVENYGHDDVGVYAPTGKAARRVQENLAANGVAIDAKTIHSGFGLAVRAEEDSSDDESDEVGGGMGGGMRDPVSIPRFVIIDEVSMLDVSVAARLLQKLPSGTHLLLVGDVHQLPPVGHGSPLRDILRSKAVPTGELTEIRRNSGLIVTACHQIANGIDFDVADTKYDPEAGNNLRAIYSINDADTLAGVAKIHRLLPGYGFDPVNDTQVIAALNTKGVCSKAAINTMLQDALNASSKKVDGKRFRVRDKVIYTKNMELAEVSLSSKADHEDPDSYFNTSFKPRVANGDIGRVVAVDEKCSIVRFDAPQRVVRINRDIEPFLDLAYAVSCHRYQGSESPVVIVVLDPAAGSVCSREYVYTAISRAKKLCILVGPEGLAQRFCKKVSINKRKTFLTSLLKSSAIAG